MGDLIMLASVLVFAIYTILMKEVPDDFDALTAEHPHLWAGRNHDAAFLRRAVVVTNWAAISLVAWGGLAFLVMFGSVISYLIFAYVMTELVASRAAAFNYLQPVIASGLGHLGAFRTADVKGVDRRRPDPGRRLSDRARTGRREGSGGFPARAG